MLNKFVHWFQKQPAWLRGGLTGVSLCTTLFIFYIGLFFPFTNWAYQGDQPDWVTLPPLVTGHFIPFFLGHDAPFVSDAICEKTIPLCIQWDIDRGCIEEIMDIEESCREKAEWIGFGLFSLFLEAIYFLLFATGNHTRNKGKKV